MTQAVFVCKTVIYNCTSGNCVQTIVAPDYPGGQSVCGWQEPTQQQKDTEAARYINHYPVQQDGTRASIQQATNELTGLQMTAAQIHSAIDFGTAAFLLLVMLIGFKFGANTVNRAQGRGGDL